jgi:hypothetical protein
VETIKEEEYEEMCRKKKEMGRSGLLFIHIPVRALWWVIPDWFYNSSKMVEWA